MKKSMSFAAVALMALAACVSSCTKEDIVATTISTDPTSVVMYVDSTVQLKAVVEPTNAKVTWRSEDMNTASVDANGVVTAKAAGEVKIFAESGNIQAATKVVAVNTPVSLGLELLGIEQKKCTVSITPSYEEGYYYCTIIDKETADSKTDAELKDLAMDYLKSVLEQYASQGATWEQLLEDFQGTNSYIFTGMEPEHEYVMFGFGIDTKYGMAGPSVTRLDMKTIPIEKSSMTISLNCDSVRLVPNTKKEGVIDTIAYITATPSADDTYLFNGLPTATLTKNYGGDPMTYLAAMEAYYEQNYSYYGGVKMIIKEGKVTLGLKNPVEGEKYTFIAAGYKYDQGFSTEAFAYEYEYKAETIGKMPRLVRPMVSEDVAEVIEFPANTSIFPYLKVVKL